MNGRSTLTLHDKLPGPIWYSRARRELRYQPFTRQCSRPKRTRAGPNQTTHPLPNERRARMSCCSRCERSGWFNGCPDFPRPSLNLSDPDGGKAALSGVRREANGKPPRLVV
jgi:hypothetical protein